jgi:DNA-directed RNA polymerase specialized sigma24 family protein
VGARTGDRQDRGSFEDVVATEVVRVRRAVVARCGAEVGGEIVAEVVVWAWEHRDEVLEADNPAGLLYRVAQSRARPYRRWDKRRAPIELLPEEVVGDRRPELVDVVRCLAALPSKERIAVVMVHAHGERYADVARVLGVTEAAVTNHVHRGMKRLRSMLEENA